ncbi:capping protein inhibiting regulator of actin dynamics-like [Pectinophora gossypiella]|uniref:capping protein inhibiting regulator of actin dynamics-like n=1 Tax=Pectinophora gossypiella TaxID=13191 RepID=UPI00214F2C87|nr:capping protein inhibiting regulator of actin dynamics-like [Pectinophora gossypiella]
MSAGIEKMNVGDSARNRPSVELKCKKSNHVFDGAGENVQYHSDSESLGSRKSKTRYINPAIYIEPVEASQSVTSLHESCAEDVIDVTPHPHTTYRSNSTPLLSGRESSVSSGSVKRISCRLSGTATIYHADVDETPRNSLTYRDGSDTFRLSVASLSTTTTAKEERERNERKKQQAFEQWLARKAQEKRDKARLEKLKRQSVSEPTPEQREEAFRRWLDRKRSQNEHRKAEDIMRRYREHERLDNERNERLRNKEEKLQEWIRKKEEEMKAMKTREERRNARAAIEEQRRRSQGERAYRDWLRTSKNKPLPVPLNKGELSMRGSVSQMYINPIPWQSST